MNKALKITLYSIPVIAGCAFAFMQYKKYKKQQAQQLLNDKKNNAGKPIDEVINGGTAITGCTFPLKKGSNNNCVKVLQQGLINSFGTDALAGSKADGIWGNKTEAAVNTYLGITQIDSPEQYTAFKVFLNV